MMERNTPAQHRTEQRRRMRLMLLFLVILFCAIFGYKYFAGMMMRKYMAKQSQVVTVSTMKVGFADWQPVIKAAGTLRAVNGVNVTTEVPGIIQAIYFNPGDDVKANTPLIQLNADNDIALLHSAQANAALADITYKRDQQQFKIEGVSKQVVDNDSANLKSLLAQVAQQQAIVDKKTIRAPFSGRLGINLIDIGQYLNPGNAIVMLQTLDPVLADFYVPQQSIGLLKMGQKVVITSDANPGKEFVGEITTINPGVDADTRNVEVEATIPNPNKELVPGIFVTAKVHTGAPQRYVTVPQTVVFFNPYGEIVYVVKDNGKDKTGQPNLSVKQRFVTTGDARGDQITILKGLNGGETIVSSGQLKLKNNSQIAVNNKVVPSDSANPDLPNSH
jgi:membrane fusion protein (multidrug efflux system)